MMDVTNTAFPRVLFITTDLSSARNISDVLDNNGFYVKISTGCKQALTVLKEEKYDICLMDIPLSDGDGYSLCASIKELYSIPVIFVSTASEENNIVSAFDVGADDFITIPFREKEFISRINRFINSAGKDSSIMEFKNIRVDTVRGLVTKNNKEIFLSALEYRMLLLFLANRGKILSREMLLDEIWHMDGHYINDNTLTVYIKRIREKLEDKPSSPKIIKTVRGKGYRTGE